jgi:hypothetical protein
VSAACFAKGSGLVAAAGPQRVVRIVIRELQVMRVPPVIQVPASRADCPIGADA